MHTYCVTSFKMGQFINVRSLKNDAVTLGSLISLHYMLCPQAASQLLICVYLAERNTRDRVKQVLGTIFKNLICIRRHLYTF